MANDVAEILNAAHNSCGYLATIKSFTEDDLVYLLQKLGDLQYKAAIRTLHQMRKSLHPVDELNSTITNLRSAYEQFAESASTNVFRFLGDALAASTGRGHIRQIRGCGKASGTALLIAICYCYKGDTHLMKEWMELSRKSFDEYARNTLARAELYKYNPNAPFITFESPDIKRVAQEKVIFEETIERLEMVRQKN